MRPVLEQEPAPVGESVEPRAVVRAEAAPHREVVRSLEDVDGVQLKPAHVFDEAAEAPGGERGRAGAGEVLPLEEERGDGAQRDGATWHPMESTTARAFLRASPRPLRQRRG